MILALGVLLAFMSALYFPWPVTALLALLCATVEPLIPLSVGLFVDLLYYTPALGLPQATLYGALGTTIAFFVRSRLRAGSIG